MIESVVTETGVRKPLIWGRSKSKYRFIQFSRKYIYISIDDFFFINEYLSPDKVDRLNLLDAVLQIGKNQASDNLNLFWNRSINRLKSMMKLGRFMKNDDYILMGRAGYIPNHEII